MQQPKKQAVTFNNLQQAAKAVLKKVERQAARQQSTQTDPGVSQPAVQLPSAGIQGTGSAEVQEQIISQQLAPIQTPEVHLHADVASSHCQSFAK